jgi:hypothetical protein
LREEGGNVVPDVEYERAPARDGLTRRQGRWVIFLLFVNTALLATYVAGPQFTGAIRQQWNDWVQRRAAAKQQAAAAARAAQMHQQFLTQQQQWLGFQFAPGTVVFEEDPKIASAMLISGKEYQSVVSNGITSYIAHWQPAVLAPRPDAVATFVQYGAVWREGALLVHERRTPGGQPKLVGVTVIAVEQRAGVYQQNSPDRAIVLDVGIIARGYDPSATADAQTWDVKGLKSWKTQRLNLTLPREVASVIHDRGNGSYEVRPGAYFRVFAGAVDDKDPTHFTIPYQLGTMNGTIDGWLREDAIELRGREGEMGPQSSWKLPVPPKPATAPTTRPAG